MTIRVLRLNFLECESFFESNSPDILALCETNLVDSVDFGYFSVRGYLPLNQQDFTTHMHGVAVYVKEVFLHGIYLQKTLRILTYNFDWLYFTQCLHFTFSCIDHLLRLHAWFLMVFHVTQMLFSRSTHLLMFWSLETLTSIIRTG